MKTLTNTAALLIVLALMMFPAAAGFAQDYPLNDGGLVVESSGAAVDGDGGAADGRIAPGDTVTLRGGGFVPGSEVTVTIESEPVQLATTTADERGDIEVTVTVPDGFPLGDHTLKASGESAAGGVLVLAQPVEVAVAATADVESSATASALTGQMATALLALLGLAVVVGAAVVVVRR